MALSKCTQPTLWALPFLNRKFKEPFLAVLTSYMSLTYIGFVIWAAFSYFYAINPTEVLVTL